MRVAVVLAVVALATEARAAEDKSEEPVTEAPVAGKGTRIWGEVGGGWYNGTFIASRGNEGGRVGLDGPALRLRAGAGFEVARGLFLGPSAGLDWAFTDSTRDVCCGAYQRVDIARIGVEGAYYFDRRVGFRVQAGFGLALAGLRPDAEGRAQPGALGATYPGGVYWTAAIARDYAVGARTRLGGVLRVEADVLSGRDGDHVYTVRTLTPSLSIVVLTHWLG